jgi:hypothetical protein
LITQRFASCHEEAVFIFPRDVSYCKLSSNFDRWMSWKQQFIQVRSIVKRNGTRDATFKIYKRRVLPELVILQMAAPVSFKPK